MGRKLSLAAAAYKLVWLRMALFFIIPFFGVFLSETEDYSDAAWAELGMFRRARIYLKSSMPGLVALAALYDTTAAGAKKKYEALKEEQVIRDMAPEDGP